MDKKTQKKYHKLSYKQVRNLTGTGFDFLFIIDDFESIDMFEITGLKASTMKDGVYPIILCRCEMIGCGGINIKTHIQGEDIIWEKFWDGQSCEFTDDEELLEYSIGSQYGPGGENLVITAPMRFNLKEYSELADKLVKESDKSDKNKAQFKENLERYLSGDVFIP